MFSCFFAFIFVNFLYKKRFLYSPDVKISEFLFNFAVNMRHFVCSIIFLLALFPIKGTAQELTLQGRVVDAQTGETLPYVSIYVGEGRGTLTNADGDFKLMTDAGSELTFSYIGYIKQRIKASDINAVIRLRPYSTTLKEVTVRPIQAKDLLERTIDNLRQDYLLHGRQSRKYFFRTLLEKEESTYLAEAFIMAYSVVNVRKPMILKGLEKSKEEEDKDRLSLRSLNIHELIKAGPMTNESSFWRNGIKPLSDLSTLHKYYDVQFYLLQGEEGNTLCRVDFLWKKKRTPEKMQKSGMSGTAFIDTETCRLLRFDGSCDNYFLRSENSKPSGVSINIHIEYDYSEGAANVSHISISGKSASTRYRALLFAVDDNQQQTEKMQPIGFNFVEAIKDAGYDAMLWDEYDIVRRTREEERIAFGE